MWASKDVVAGDASCGGRISGAVGGRYRPRGVYRGSYSSGVTQADVPKPYGSSRGTGLAVWRLMAKAEMCDA